MKKLTLLAFFAVLAIILANCASDIILPKPPEISGKYYGWFVFDSDVADPDTQAILWEFDKNNPSGPTFRMNVDLDSPDLNPKFCLCQVFGLYDIQDRVELRPNLRNFTVPDIAIGEDTCNTCNIDQIPSGKFSFIRIVDTVKLTQSSDTLTVQIILLPDTTSVE